MLPRYNKEYEMPEKFTPPRNFRLRLSFGKVLLGIIIVAVSFGLTWLALTMYSLSGL